MLDFNSKVKITHTCSKDCLKYNFCHMFREDHDSYGWCHGLMLKRDETDTLDKYLSDLRKIISRNSSRDIYVKMLEGNVCAFMSEPLELYLSRNDKQNVFVIKFKLADVRYTIEGVRSFRIIEEEGEYYMCSVDGEDVREFKIKLDF